MKNRILFALIGLMLPLLAIAQAVSPEQARATAEQYMKNSNARKAKGRGDVVAATPKLTMAHAARGNAFYVFNMEEEQGFVIVSGDERTPEILGYSYQGRIDTGNLPDNVRWMFDYYEQSISSLTISSAKKTAAENKQSIAPLIKTEWGQGGPFNDLCPTVDQTRCVTGCVATAMAQVVNCHRWPTGQTSAVAAYVTPSRGIFMHELPATRFDWDAMTSSSIARLMLYCGQSVQMDYSPFASGAVTELTVDALKNVFGYSKGASFVYRNDFGNDSWIDLVYSELTDGRPLLYSGFSPRDGHAFVVDGYDDGLFHVNWGWEGYCDGYFTLDNLNPDGESAFEFEQGMAINVCPPTDATEANRSFAIVSEVKCTERELNRTDASVDFPAFNVVCTVESDLNADATVQLGLALYDEDGFVAELSDETVLLTTGGSSKYEHTVKLGADLQDGTYRIVAVNRKDASKEWLADIGSLSRYIEMKISAQELHLMPMPMSDEDRNDMFYGIHTIGGITYKLEDKRAAVLPYLEAEKYSGDLFIPDYVEYKGKQFQVIEANSGYLCDSPELTSLSLGVNMFWGITNCPKLKHLEFREGLERCHNPAVSDCDALESVVFPATLLATVTPVFCRNLKTIIFKKDQRFAIEPYWWDHTILSEESLPALQDIYLATDVPPLITQENETNYVLDPRKTLNVHIPVGSLDAYENSEWAGCNFIEDQPAPIQGVKWDYCGFDEFSYSGTLVGQGENNVEYAMRIPAECLTAYKGCKVAAIQFYTTAKLPDDDHWDAEYAFLATTGTDYLLKTPVTTLARGSWTTVEFPEPLVITGEELFVGLGRHRAFGMVWANTQIVEEDGMWLRVMGEDRRGGYEPGKWYKNECGNNPLPLRAIIQGDKLPTDIVIDRCEIVATNGGNDTVMKTPRVSRVQKKAKRDDADSDEFFIKTVQLAQDYSTAFAVRRNAEARSNSQVKIRMRNRTPRTVKEVVLNWNIDDTANGQHIVKTVFPFNNEQEIYIDLPDDIAGRRHRVTVNVETVDGEPDEIAANSIVTGVYNTPATITYPRKVVMEEAAGTWCGWCPRGIVTIEKMKETYPDNFIIIAIHNDEMQLENDGYNQFYDQVGCYPGSLINRTDWRDPWPFDIDVEQDRSDAMITAEARFVEGRKIEINAKTRFGFNDNGTASFNIAYVLTEDNVGPYMQSNFYSDPSAENNSEDILDWWIHQPNNVETYFNDVARAIFEDYNGVKGQLPRNIEAGAEYPAKYIATIPGNVQNPANLKVVVLLIDSDTGEIINADQTAISGPIITPNGIVDVQIDDNAEITVYDLTGLMVYKGKKAGMPKFLKGLYIIKYGDKSIKYRL